MRSYNCMTCQEPMQVSLMFDAFIRREGPQDQRCGKCGCVHHLTSNSISLKERGVIMARLSQEYVYPDQPPTRVGAYRVRFSNGQWAKSYWYWDGHGFVNGPIRLSRGSITSWQGLAGDMEHLRTMPYDLPAPIPAHGDDHEH